MRRAVLVAVCLLTAAPAAAQQASFDIKSIDPETFRAIAFRLADGQQPRIDGRLTEEVWSLAPPQGNFIQREPAYGSPASEATEFRILYDDRTLYIGVWVWDSTPGGIMGSEMKRDSGLNKGDQIKITIDTFHDHRNGYLFRSRSATLADRSGCQSLRIEPRRAPSAFP